MKLMTDRQYMVQVSENSYTDQFHISLHQIEKALKTNDPGELYFAMNEEVDKILDLKVNESMYFRPNRDDKNSKGIITRIQ
jgi:hypothetical protein